MLQLCLLCHVASHACLAPVVHNSVWIVACLFCGRRLWCLASMMFEKVRMQRVFCVAYATPVGLASRRQEPFQKADLRWRLFFVINDAAKT